MGNIHKGYYIVDVIKVLPYNISYKERESLGNGWYGSKVEIINKTIDDISTIIY